MNEMCRVYKGMLDPIIINNQLITYYLPVCYLLRIHCPPKNCPQEGLFPILGIFRGTVFKGHVFLGAVPGVQFLRPLGGQKRPL